MKGIDNGYIGTYEYEDDVQIDIFLINDTYEAWIYRKNIGVKNFMFGLPRIQHKDTDHPEIYTFDMIMEIVECNVEDYIEIYDEELAESEERFLEKLDEKHEHDCDECCCDECEECECNGDNYDDSVYEAIDMHNEAVDKLQELGEALLKQYSDVEETPVNDAFCETYKCLTGMAIYLCCEANAIDGGKWMTTEDWHVMREEDLEND